MMFNDDGDALTPPAPAPPPLRGEMALASVGCFRLPVDLPDEGPSSSSSSLLLVDDHELVIDAIDNLNPNYN